MRHSLIMMSILPMLAQAATAPDGATMQEAFTTCTNLECGRYTSSKFSMGEHFLSGKIVRGETFFADGDGEREFKMAFKPERIISVFNQTTGEIYIAGTDYLETKDGISIPKDSRIKFSPHGFASPAPAEDLKNYGVRMTTEFQGYQYSVSYEKSSFFAVEQHGKLGRLKEKFGKSPVNITFFGDSITAGANATAESAPPHQPGYAGLVAARLNDLYPTLVSYRNNSVGGWSAINATASVEYRVNDLKSDLVVLAFGMNDGGGYTPDEYHKHIKYVIDAIRAKQPDTAILLVSPTRANPSTFTQNREYVSNYWPKLVELSENYKNVKAVNLTSLWDRLLVNKHYLDLTGNGLNHPNDFGHRMIAEAVLYSIIE
ncbi:SGNH/GDSL hydrolase family protein [Pseudomonas peradeniyensis]|uniref:SGNH/GDSL hydrolase family protein n=1 Tax=Pseudomonas peradeniyensis TaxID=2745488 RepID=A0ABT2VAN8_9PSED|nr:SGNH/GDSL hydrolase family protein [Pseudomonas peradeniyensis]MCU7238779.1 SGNH/GDSL hydrolase family protein [Pseudomonas peradeniyensis]